jgi:predicted DNA-binding protein with PD1-like motif
MRAHGDLLVFDKGDEVLAVLQQFINDQQIPSAWFQAIGAFERSVIAYWNRETKQYEDIAVDEQVEVLALSGNVTPKRFHGHVVLGRRDGSTLGGHLKRGIVYPTLELHLTRFTHELVRARDEETGLELIR